MATKKQAAKAKPEQFKIVPAYQNPQNFQEALSNYSIAYSKIMQGGIQNVTQQKQNELNKYAVQVRDFETKDLGPSAKQVLQDISDVENTINSYVRQKNIVNQKATQLRAMRSDDKRRLAFDARYNTENDALMRLRDTANQLAPRVAESLNRIGIADILPGIGVDKTGATSIGEAINALSLVGSGQTNIPSQLSSASLFQTGNLAGKLNSQLTDEQILSDINSARQARYKSLYDIGTAAIADLQSQISVANNFLSALPEGDRRRTATQDTIKKLSTDLTKVQSDTLKAENLYKNYQPISQDQSGQFVSKFRESLRLPEERTLQQIREIDPQLFQSLQGISRGYQKMAATPLGATQAESTEQLRKTVEEEALNQLRLGSTIGAEERRGYEQAIRSAQTARGNIFGLGPAVQEAAQIGAAGEQRKLARYGAAAQFLGSGQTMSDAMARDIGLRNALEQSRLGAAAGFAAAGPSLYGMASQRLGQQQAALGQYLAAAQPQMTPGFQATPSAANPYAYVNPNAGFIGAQNAAGIYNTLADLQASQYGSQVGAIARQPSGAEQFGQIATGLSNLIKI